MPKVKEMKQKMWTGRKLPLVMICGTLLADAGFQAEDSSMVAIYQNTLITIYLK
ncbi:hypothetical protein SAMN05518672_103433 [Chitinophaga sp. CF118]|nr:hypothetical protein SAMN05518672_103433 [Chitinophaga sp. CF118]